MRKESWKCLYVTASGKFGKNFNTDLEKDRECLRVEDQCNLGKTSTSFLLVGSLSNSCGMICNICDVL